MTCAPAQRSGSPTPARPPPSGSPTPGRRPPNESPTPRPLPRSGSPTPRQRPRSASPTRGRPRRSGSPTPRPPRSSSSPGRSRAFAASRTSGRSSSRSVAGGALVVAAPTPRATLAVAIYAASLSALLGVSALYHRVNWRRPGDPPLDAPPRPLDDLPADRRHDDPIRRAGPRRALGECAPDRRLGGRRGRDRRRADLGRRAEVGDDDHLPVGGLDRRCSASPASWSARASAPGR